jgi:hypothetical protein
VIVLRVIGWVSVAAAAFCAVQTWWLDLSMQRHRSPSAPSGAFRFVPLRWQQNLYIGDGPVLVARAWRAWRRMIGLSILGMVCLAIGTV